MKPGDSSGLWQFVLYDKTTSDLRGWYSVRPVLVAGSTPQPWRINCIARTRAELESPFQHLHWLSRFPQDDPVILGIWL